MGISIDTVTQGFSKSGAQEYLNDLNAKAIDETKNLLSKTSELESTLAAGWQGQAELNFVKNLHNAIETTKKSLDECKEALKSEMAQIEEVWATQDAEMVKVED